MHALPLLISYSSVTCYAGHLHCIWIEHHDMDVLQQPRMDTVGFPWVRDESRRGLVVYV